MYKTVYIQVVYLHGGTTNIPMKHVEFVPKSYSKFCFMLVLNCYDQKGQPCPVHVIHYFAIVSDSTAFPAKSCVL